MQITKWNVQWVQFYSKQINMNKAMFYYGCCTYHISLEIKFENNIPPLLNLTLNLTDSEANLG